MEADELERITSLGTESQKKYPPYLMSQLRWALHCYRWRENLKWSKYPEIICNILGFELNVYDDDEKQKKEREKNILDFQKETTQQNDAKKEPSPINIKDPKIWIVKGKEPIKEQKIQAYIDFLKKEAPEYVEAFTDEGFSNKVCDFLYAYCANQPTDEKKIEELSAQANHIEKYVFITVYPDNGSLSLDETKVRLNRLHELGLNDGHYIVHRKGNYFKSADTIVAFRQIGVTPFMKFFIFGTDCLEDLDFRPPPQLGSRIVLNHRERDRHQDSETIDEIFRQNTDRIKFKSLHTGIVCPGIVGRKYIGIAKSKDRFLAQVNIVFQNWDIEMGKPSDAPIDLNDRRAMMGFNLYPDHDCSILTEEYLYAQSPIVMNPYQVDSIQNIISTLKP